MKMKNQTFISFLISLSLVVSQLYAAELDVSNKEIQVGVILVMESWLGKVIHSCITMAISDFYALNSHYKTRIALHTRDSKSDPLHVFSAALDLLENIKVQAIIGPQLSSEAKVLALLGDKAKVPMISFSAASPSSVEHPYSVQITQDETTQFEGIAALVEAFKWREVILIHEDTDYGRQVVPNMVDCFQEKNIHVAYRSAISPLATDDLIVAELHKFMTMQTTIFIVHVSPFLACHLFLNAKRLGIMSEEFVWILTDKTMNFLHSLDSSVVESMQGTLGIRSYTPASSELHNFTLRWRREFWSREPDNMEVRELNVFGMLAYDATCALAQAIERVSVEVPRNRERDAGLNLVDFANIRISHNGPILLNKVSNSRFKGLSGDFQLKNGKLISEAFEIVNVIGKGERRVGFWTATGGFTKEKYPSFSRRLTSSTTALEAVIWPGGSTTTPKGWLMRMSGKKLRIAVPSNGKFKELVHVERDPETKETAITGFCIDVFTAAIESLQYEVPYEFIPFTDALGYNAGTYNDLIDQVYLQNYDAAVGDLTITANRSLYVDFTLPFTDIGVGTIARVDSKNMWIFLKPLDANLWLTSAGFFILMSSVIWVIEHPINEEFQGSPAQQIGTSLWFSFSTLVFAHREKLLSNLSRFVVIIWLFVVLILTSSYTATLSSLLTVEQIQLASNGNYIGYQAGSFVRGAIVSNLNFKDYRIRPYFSPEEYAYALSKGSKNGGVAAIIDEIPYIKIFLAKYSPEYAMIASESTTNGFAFVFQKGSPLVRELSRAIAKLRAEGKLEMMEKAWFKSQTSLMPQNSTNNPSILKLDNFGGLFLISGMSSALALLIFSIYSIYKKFRVQYFIFRILVRGKLAFMIKYMFPNTVNIIGETSAGQPI